MTVAEQAETVLAFWFDELDDRQRFARDPAVDTAVRERFGSLHAELAAGVPAAWQASPRTRLAAIIVLDQFSRNLFRDDARAFAHDGAARALTARALECGDDTGLTSAERQFLYMPLMHGEDPADQESSVALFTALGEPDALAFAERHQAAIARFGRFPARNAALGRTSTPDEIAYLAEHAAGF